MINPTQLVQELQAGAGCFGVEYDLPAGGVKYRAAGVLQPGSPRVPVLIIGEAIDTPVTVDITRQLEGNVAEVRPSP